MKLINQFKNLQKLNLNINFIIDNDIFYNVNIQQTNNTNLCNTKITDAFLSSFSKMKNLQKVYSWKTKITGENIKHYLFEKFPGIILG